jgi:hypothetical protein
MELFAAACALSRWDLELTRNDRKHYAAARLAVADSLRQADSCLRAMGDNDALLIREAAISAI